MHTMIFIFFKLTLYESLILYLKQNYKTFLGFRVFMTMLFLIEIVMCIAVFLYKNF